MLRGLTDLSDDTLERLLRALHRGELEAPLTATALALAGFQDVSEALLGSLRGLDARAVRAVLVAVVAERRRRDRGAPARRP